MAKVRAQITLFVILAIVIVVAVLGIFYLKGFGLNGKKPEVEAIRNYISSEIENTGNICLEGISAEGGVVYPKKNYVAFMGVALPYWYHTVDMSPSLIEIENSISECIEKFLPSLVDFETFEDFEISAGHPQVQTTIKSNYIQVNVKYPVTAASKDGTIYKIEKSYTYDMDIRLGKIYNAARSIVKEQIKNPEDLCIDCLTDIGLANNLKIEARIYEDSLIITIIDEKAKLGNIPYKFSFAGKLT